MTINLKSISKLLFLAILLTVGFLVYKKMTIDNSEEINVIPVKPVKISQQQRTQHEEKSFDVVDSLPNVEEVTYQDKINHQKKVGSALNKSLMYDTPEKVLKAIMYYQENNDEEKAAEFIDYLLEKFPDYKVDL
jgi:hypothetical protein